jgi:hypothetical protein
MPGIIKKVVRFEFIDTKPVEGKEDEPAYWYVSLDCGHNIAILADHFAPCVVGHYCPACEFTRDSLANMPGPEAG